MEIEVVYQFVERVGLIGAIALYTLFSVKKSVDANTKVIIALSERMGVSYNAGERK
jgi:hypothetical protein